MLTWKPPLNDGGGFITQYIVEKLEQGMSSWIRWGPTRSTLNHGSIYINYYYYYSFNVHYFCA